MDGWLDGWLDSWLDDLQVDATKQDTENKIIFELDFKFNPMSNKGMQCVGVIFVGVRTAQFVGYYVVKTTALWIWISEQTNQIQFL